MADRLYIAHSGTSRAVITDASNGERWDPTADSGNGDLVTHADGDWSDYLLAPTQIGTSRDWHYIVPAALPAGDYLIAVYDGSDPAVDDAPIGGLEFRWTGSAAILGRADNRDGGEIASQSSVDAVLAKLAAGVPVRLVSPVAPDGTTLDLVRADDYTSGLVNRPWQFLADVEFVAENVASVTLRVRDKQSGDELFESEGAAEDVTIDDDDLLELTGGITNAQSSELTRGRNTALFDLLVVLTDGTRYTVVADGEVNVSGGAGG